MFILETDYYLILYIQSIILFILVGFLIYLITKNKLTYVDEFRQKFVLGIYLYLCGVVILIIFQIILKIPQEFYLILYGVIVLSEIGFMALTLLGTSKLIDYISSIIDLETKNKRNYALLISAIISTIYTILYGIFNASNASKLTLILLVPWTVFFYFLSCIYTLFLHQEMKKIDLKFLLYIGLSFFCLCLSVFPAIFLDPRSDLFHLVLNLFLLIGANVFLIIGYLDFKNRISRGLVK